MLNYFRLRSTDIELKPTTWENLISWANFVTLFRLLLLIPVGIFLWDKQLLEVAVLLCLVGFLDMLDGHLARIQKNATVFGSYFDKTTDKSAWLVVLLILWLKHMAPPVLIGLVFVAHVAHPLFSWFYFRKYKKLPRLRLQLLVALSAALLIFFPGYSRVIYSLIAVTCVHYLYYLMKIVWLPAKTISETAGRRLTDIGWYTLIGAVGLFFLNLWFWGAGRIQSTMLPLVFLALIVAVIVSLFSFAHPYEPMLLPMSNAASIVAIIIATLWNDALSLWLMTFIVMHIIFSNVHHFWHMWFAPSYPPYVKTPQPTRKSGRRPKASQNR